MGKIVIYGEDFEVTEDVELALWSLLMVQMLVDANKAVVNKSKEQI